MKYEALYRRLVHPVISLLKQGITPEKIALSLAIGIVLGIFPALGLTTLLCAAAAIVFKLNFPSIQLVNWFVYPLQLILILPFMRAGAFLFRARPLHLSLAQMLTIVRADWLGAVAMLWTATLRAVVVWMLVGPVMSFILYILLLRFIHHLMVLVRRRPSPVTGL